MLRALICVYWLSCSMAVEELKVLSLQLIVSKVKHKITIHVSRKSKAKSYNEQFVPCLRTYKNDLI